MIREVKPDKPLVTSQIGDPFPYIVRTDKGGVAVTNNAAEALKSGRAGEKYLDPVSVLSLLDYNYINGDRTMIAGLQRMPWRATLHADGTVCKDSPIPHGNRLENAEIIAKGLLERLEVELAEVTQDYPHIIIQLSGGLDSRVSAGILKQLYPDTSSKKITAVVWGSEQSRDCVYSKRIADWYGWDWLRIPIDCGTLPDLIRIAATWGGAETSGIHLHGEEWFASCEKDAIVIASSFGDSIGRAEFSMVPLSRLRQPKPTNKLGWVRGSKRWLLQGHLLDDIKTAWSDIEDTRETTRVDHSMQENYMRRMICHAMNRISCWATLHQSFTSDEVVKWMWSFDPVCRTNKVYDYALAKIDERLWRLPWARDGVALSGDIEPDRTLTKEYSDYPACLREHHTHWLKEHLFDGTLQRMGLFNMNNIRRAWRRWERGHSADVRNLGQPLSKLAMLSLFIEAYDVRPPKWNRYVLRDRIYSAAKEVYFRSGRASKTIMGKPV